MVDKTIERTIKIPRTRLSDCCRLIFRIGKEPEWRDINLDPDLFPIYPIPSLQRSVYTLGGIQISINPGETINDLVRKICREVSSSGNQFLHTIIFRKSGEINLQIENI